MSKILNRKTLIGSAFVMGLLAAMQMPSALAGDDQGEHEHSSAPAANATGKPAPQKGQADDSQKMDHSGMAHDSMSHEHKANRTDADRDHDQ
ncbi:MAG: hypothetical protein ACRERX_07865 [Pseudomonas sp.]